MSVQELRCRESIDHPGMMFVPITSEEEKTKIKQALLPIFIDYTQKISELKERTNQIILESDRRVAEASHEADQTIAEAKREADQAIAEASREADQTIAEASREANQAIAEASREADRKRMEIIVTLFHRIFYGKQPVPEERINSLFSTYLSNGSITFDESKRCFKLYSMKCIVSYLKDHSDVKQCDLRAFKTEISDLPTLAEFLKTSTVKAIAINRGIAEEAKTSLAGAVAARNGGLKVQYFA